MPADARRQPLARFDDFVLDLRTGELCKADGKTIRFPEQSFQILTMLLERPREIVGREEIRKRLWPNDTVVEFEHSISAAMNRLRQALGDNAGEPRYIETLARRGYRWMRSVEWVDAAPQTYATVKKSEYPASSLIGKKVSHYRVLEVLGGGGMGIVYKAEDIKLGRKVALKFLPEELAHESHALERFEREARSASALNHPNICTIHEIEEHDGQPFIVMELLEGETLRDVISSTADGQPFELSKLVDLAIQIAAGLEAAHQKGIIHRDIKPSNIFITRRGEAKILDFGVAKLLALDELLESEVGVLGTDNARVSQDPKPRSLYLTRTGTAVGTEGYMSPEQIRGERVDARTDLFSFGLVLYEMATRERAFRGDTAVVLQDAILHSTPSPVQELNPAIPLSLQEIIAKALKKDLKERYQSASEMRLEIASLAGSLAAGAKDPEKSNPPPSGLPGVQSGNQQQVYSTQASTSNRFRRIRFILVGCLVAIAAVGTWWGWHTWMRPKQSHAAVNSKTFPLGTFRGGVGSFAFSPDDRQIAFLWGGPSLGKSNVYVEVIGGERPLQITHTQSGGISSIEWSPDGRLLSFARCGDEDRGEIHTISPLGGPEQKLTDVACSYGGVDAAWTPDGSALVLSDPCVPGGPMSIVVYALATGKKRCLATPDSAGTDLGYGTMSWDGKTVAYLENTTMEKGDIYVVPIAGGTPRQITHEGRNESITSFSRDNKYIDFTSDRTGHNGITRWRVPVQGGAIEPDPVVTHDGVLSSDGRVLAYQENGGFESAIWRANLSAPGGKVISKAKIVSGSTSNLGPELSPNGKYVTYTSGLSGAVNIWRSDADGANPTQLTAFGGDLSGTPRWSPDGKLIILDRRHGPHAQIYMMDGEGRNPHAITAEASYENNVGSWSRDGKSIYFSSDRTGHWELWKHNLESGVEIQITQHGGFSAFESYDGKDLYYAKFFSSGIWRMPVAGGQEQRVVDGLATWFWGSWDVTETGLYFLDVDAPLRPAIMFYNFRTHKTNAVFQPEGQTMDSNPSLCVSRDGRTIYYAQYDQNSTIIIMQDFQ
jgi:serine/threonine protein kinase/Tol biopolymer transport system component